MSKTLILMRHGHYNPFSKDYELTNLGKQQAENIADQLLSHGYKPDMILHSGYTRTVETAQGVQKIFNAASGIEIAVVENPDLIDAKHLAPIRFIQKFDDNAHVILAVTHQPLIETVTGKLTGDVLSPEFAEAMILKSDENSWKRFNRASHIATLRPNTHK